MDGKAAKRGARGRRVTRRTALVVALAALILPASASAADSVYWSAEGAGTIRLGDLDGTGTAPTLFGGEGGPCGLAIDAAAGKLYWANFSSGGIREANLDGTGTATTLFDGGVGSMCGVAIDPAHNKIYWADFTNNLIRVGNLDGTGTASTLFAEAPGTAPSGVAIDPAANKIVWTNQFSDEVRVANLDGTGTASTLYGPPGEDNPIGVAIDSATGTIYWTDIALGTVRTGNLDGTDTASTLFGGESSPGGVALDPAAGKIYWDSFSGSIRFGNLDGSGTASTLFGGEGSPLFAAVLKAPTGVGSPGIAPPSPTQPEELSCSEGDWAPDLLGAFLYQAPRSFTYQWQKDGDDIPDADEATFTPTEDGSYTCEVTASNQAGSSAPQTSAAHIVDGTPPDTEITDHPADPSGSADASFSFTGEPGSGTAIGSFECKLDTGGFDPCTRPRTTPAWARAPTPSRSARSTPPATSIPPPTLHLDDRHARPRHRDHRHPADPSGSADASFCFTGDPGSGTAIGSFECKLDTGGFDPCTRPRTTPAWARAPTPSRSARSTPPATSMPPPTVHAGRSTRSPPTPRSPTTPPIPPAPPTPPSVHRRARLGHRDRLVRVQARHRRL